MIINIGSKSCRFFISHRKHRKAMRHDYPHAEAQRTQRSHRGFYFEHESTGFHGLMMRGYCPTPRCAHPSPTMGGELITTASSFGSPPLYELHPKS